MVNMEIVLRVLMVLPHILFSYELLLSLLLIAPFYMVFRPKVRYLLFGFVAYTLALIFESLVSSAPVYVLAMVLAPMIEESIKFILAKGRKGAIGVGLGFAVVENASYFLSFGLSPIFVIMRAAGDPMLHSFSTSIAIKTKERKWWGLPAAISIHSIYNLVGILLSGLPQFYFILIAGCIFFGILLLWNRHGLKSKLKARSGMEVTK